MKSVFCLLFFFIASSLAALTTEQVGKLEPISKECREKTGVTLEQVKKIRENSIFEDDPKLKKHLLCVAKKTGTITESGDVAIEVIKEKLKKAGTDEKVIEKIEKCAVKKETPEETVFEFTKCVYSHNQSYSPADK